MLVALYERGEVYLYLIGTNFIYVKTESERSTTTRGLVLSSDLGISCRSFANYIKEVYLKMC